MEFNLLPYHPGHFKFKVTPFVALGFGGMYFNPKAELNGEWIALQPLGTGVSIWINIGIARNTLEWRLPCRLIWELNGV